MRARTGFAAALLLAATGCFLFPPLATVAPSSDEPLIRAISGGSGGQTAAARVRPTGRLRLTVEWPSGPGRDLRGYHAQLIPDSTARLEITVRDAAGNVRGNAEVTREQGQADASATMTLEAGSNLAITVEAFAAESPPIARGTATVNIVPSLETDADVELSSLFVPAIERMSANAGSPGSTLTLDGQNLAVDWAPTAVAFPTASGSEPAEIQEGSATRLVVTVPPGAAIGRVAVAIDGVKSVSNAVFWAAENLAIAAARAPWDTTGDAARLLLFETPLSLAASHSWRLQEGTSPEDFGQAPLPEWAESRDGPGDLAGDPGHEATFTAGTEEGTASIQATLGTLASDPLDIGVLALGPFEEAPVALPNDLLGAKGVVAGHHLLLFGADDRSAVLRSSLDEEGRPGNFALLDPSLPASHSPAAVTVGRFVYLLGGYSTDRGGPVDTVSRAPLLDGGELGPIEAWGKLAWPVEGPVFVTSKYVYVVGGGADGKRVQRAAIDRNGYLSLFGDAGTATSRARGWTYGFSAGKYAYLAGSEPAGDRSVERAEILPDGALTDFVSHPATLVEARLWPTGAVAAGGVYVVGGSDLASVEYAPIDEAGDLGPFKRIAATLDVGRDLAAAFAIGDYLYVLGGSGTACECSPTAIVRAPLPSVGDGESRVEVR